MLAAGRRVCRAGGGGRLGGRPKHARHVSPTCRRPRWSLGGVSGGRCLRRWRSVLLVTALRDSWRASGSGNVALVVASVHGLAPWSSLWLGVRMQHRRVRLNCVEM